MPHQPYIESLFFNIQHAGCLDEHQRGVVTLTRATSGRYTQNIYACVDPEGYIQKVCFKAFASPLILAGLEYFCQTIEGKKTATLKLLNLNDWIKALKLESEAHSPDLVFIHSFCNEFIKKLNSGKSL